MKYVVIDCEFTGLHKDSQILTISFHKLDENFKFKSKLNLAVKSSVRDKMDRGYYSVCPEAMEVNKIDLKHHEETAESRESCIVKIEQFLRHASQVYKGKDEKGNHIVDYIRCNVIGHGVRGDLQKLKELFPEVDFDKYLSSVRIHDTLSIAATLQTVGKLPMNMNLKLATLADYYDIDTTWAHQADGDCTIIHKLFLELTEEIKGPHALLEKIKFHGRL